MTYTQCIALVQDIVENFLALDFFGGTADSLPEQIEALDFPLVHLDPPVVTGAYTWRLFLAFLYKLDTDHVEADRMSSINTAVSAARKMIQGIEDQYTDTAGFLEVTTISGGYTITPVPQFDYFGVMSGGCTLRIDLTIASNEDDC